MGPFYCLNLSSLTPTHRPPVLCDALRELVPFHGFLQLALVFFDHIDLVGLHRSVGRIIHRGLYSQAQLHSV